MSEYEEDVVLEKYWPEEAAHEGKAAGSTVPLPHHFEGPKHNFPGLEMKMGATGVIWTTDRAAEKGFSHENQDWANLGQGAPEVGEIPGCFKRPTVIDASESSREYASTAGVKELREAVANLYNHDYRQGKESQYTYENVCIVPGGRAGLIRIAAILSDVYLSFFFPDYTAYAEMLALFKNFSPIPVPLKADDDYAVHLDIIRAELDRGVSALLTSNPRNPTGQAMRDQDLKDLQDMCRKRCLLIMDEFYTRYNYEDGCNGSSVSSAANVIDVNEDPVLIVDGLTKSFRLPGWRICWIIGPKSYIKALASAGSFLDGGSNAPFQKAAVPFLEPSLVKKEMTALQVHFKAKRDYCIDRLTKMGFKFHQVPNTTFYIWLDLSPLPKEINSSLHFFEACLDEKVIMVPGIFFDLNPLARREIHHSPYYHFMRLSYGPPMENLVKGMDAIERVINKYKK